MDRPGHHGAGPHSLLFQLYRVRPRVVQYGGAAGRALFLFCLVEGFTHTHSRKRYFARVYVLSTAMSLLFFFMAFAHVLVRPDGFYPPTA